MKKVLIFIMLLAGIYACENEKQIFDDFDYYAVYFPFQLPLRTLSLGEDRIDNTLDKELKFDIGVTIGGMYENRNDWFVDYVVDNSLTDSVYQGGTGLKIHPLPSEFFTLSPTGTITIPSGSFYGRLRVELTDAFLDDPLAITGQYVVPLRITSTSADTVLSGRAIFPDADQRVLEDWEAGMAPKDWTLFGVKFVNGYHGTYLQRGRDILYQGGVPVDTAEWREHHVERDRLVRLTTSGKNTAVTNFIGLRTGVQFSMELTFVNPWGTPGGAITITPVEGSDFAVTGSGEFLDKANSPESIIHLPMQSMHLNYTYDDGEYVHHVSDTLVFRDRQLRFEENTIIIAR